MKIEELQVKIGIKNEEEIKSKLGGIRQNIDEITKAAERLNNVLDEINGDNVPVIRCKNCQNFNNKSCATGYGTCLILGRMMKNDEYCCYGKERDNEVDHTDKP